MTVVYDAATEQQRSASAATTTFAHVAGAGTRGVLVGFVRAVTTTDNISAVSYGGTNLVRVNRATDTSTEPGAVEWWFAPHTGTGSQNVAYNVGVTGSNIHVVAITITGEGTPYVLASQIKQVDNTASSSVSLTTGYVSGLAFGAIYWGGADATTITPGSGSETVHSWDMGAYGSYVHRLTTATTPGTGPLLGFGTTQGSDDLAYAALFITDGVQAVGEPQAAATLCKVEGRAPTLIPYLSATVTPGVGATAMEGRAVTAVGFTGVERTITPAAPAGGAPSWFAYANNAWSPLYASSGMGLLGQTPTVLTEWTSRAGVGASAIAGLAPTLVTEGVVLPGVGAITLDGREPAVGTEWTTLPGVGAASLGGLEPTVATETTVEATITPDVGAVTLDGREPALITEGVALPGVGAFTLEGRQPALASDGVALPGVGSISLDGRTPSTATERVILPGTGAAALDGREPALLTATAVAPTATAVTVEGRAPTLVGETVTQPGVGSITLEGRAPFGAAELPVYPGVGLVTLEGRIPTYGIEGIVTVTPDTAGLTLDGRASSLITEAVASPDVGSVSLQGAGPALLTEATAAPAQAQITLDGRTPTVEQGGTVELTVEPGLAALAFTALAPTLPSSIRGHVETGRRWRTRYYGETSLGPIPLLDVDPTPPAPLPPEPPLTIVSVVPAVEAAEVTDLTERLSRLEARRIRRRREEEALIAFLLKHVA